MKTHFRDFFVVLNLLDNNNREKRKEKRERTKIILYYDLSFLEISPRSSFEKTREL